MKRPPINWRGIAAPLAVIAAAEIAARASHLRSDTLAAPDAIVAAGARALLDGSLLTCTAQTMAAALGGLAAGGAIGLGVGVAIGFSRWLNSALGLSMELIRPIPSVALIPIMLLVFGFGFRMEIAIVAFASVWPVLLLTRAAIRGLEPRLLEVARVMQFRPRDIVLKFVLPAILPRVFVAFRLAIGVALIVAVTVEIAVNPLGLGSGMMEAEQALRPAIALAFLVWIGLLGWALDAGLGAIHQRYLTLPGMAAQQ